MSIGKKKYDDMLLNIETLKSANRKYNNKNAVLKALMDQNVAELREISNYFYRTSGIYSRVVNYFAQMYRYDWYLDIATYDKLTKAQKKKQMTELFKSLDFFDSSYITKTCSDIALQVIKNGVYYACVVSTSTGISFQELPVGYCRSRYKVGQTPIVEINLKFFDDKFADAAYRARVLKMFPEDIQKGYVLYKSGKLKPDTASDTGAWYALAKGSAVKFDFGNSDMPLFASAIPCLLDLEAAQDLDRRRQMQKLVKILVQKLPLDKNGDLIFDVDEAKDIHANAVQMLGNAIGVDVLTTFADVEPIDISDKTTTTTNDELEKVERSLYNAFGTAQNLFNADGNIATTNSILNDEAMCRNLLLQFEAFYDSVAQMLSSNNKKWKFRFYMLPTTQYNYKELAKLYKEQTQLGFSKLLPQIALGHSQSFIYHSCKLENETLELYKIMIPPMMSSTMNGDTVLDLADEKKAGRTELEDSEKSDKTIRNSESEG